MQDLFEGFWCIIGIWHWLWLKMAICKIENDLQGVLNSKRFYMKKHKNGSFGSLDSYLIILKVARSLLAAGPHGPFWARWSFPGKHPESTDYWKWLEKMQLSRNLQCGGWFFCPKRDTVWFIYSWGTIRIRPSSRRWRLVDIFNYNVVTTSPFVGFCTNSSWFFTSIGRSVLEKLVDGSGWIWEGKAR